MPITVKISIDRPEGSRKKFSLKRSKRLGRIRLKTPVFVHPAFKHNRTLPQSPSSSAPNHFIRFLSNPRKQATNPKQSPTPHTNPSYSPLLGGVSLLTDKNHPNHPQPQPHHHQQPQQPRPRNFAEVVAKQASQPVSPSHAAKPLKPSGLSPRDG